MENKCINYKCGLLAVNTILLLLALGLLSLGSFFQAAFHTHLGMIEGRITSPVIPIIFLGFILLASSLFGFISTIRENYILLSAYVCSVVIIIIFELGVGVAVFSMKFSLKALVIRSMHSAEAHYNNSKATACMWDAVQNYLKCCGMERFEEWPVFLGNDTVPDSCCIRYSLGCGYHIKSADIHQNGCITAIHGWLFRNQIIIGVLCTIFILIQISALLLAHRYCNLLNRRCSVTSRNFTPKHIFKRWMPT